MYKLIVICTLLLTLDSCGGAASDPQSVAPVVANQPTPDCAPQQCSGLRIIDGNAESYRYDRLRQLQDLNP